MTNGIALGNVKIIREILDLFTRPSVDTTVICEKHITIGQKQDVVLIGMGVFRIKGVCQ